MNTFTNPTNVAPPLGAYTHSIKVPAQAQWLVIAGQVGIAKNGKLARGISRQAEQCYRNILSCLKANGMTKGDLVKTTVYLTDARHVPEFRVARDKVMGADTRPTSTLLIIDGLADPEMLIEIEAWAAH